MSAIDAHTLRWHKSTRSGTQGGNCVEVAATDTDWYVRDSKNPHAGYLAVTAEGWRSFVRAVRSDALGCGVDRTAGA